MGRRWSKQDREILERPSRKYTSHGVAEAALAIPTDSKKRSGGRPKNYVPIAPRSRRPLQTQARAKPHDTCDLDLSSRNLSLSFPVRWISSA